MRIFDAESPILKDLLDESEAVAEKEHSHFKVSAVRHPTLGKVVVVEGHDGRGVIVEAEE